MVEINYTVLIQAVNFLIMLWFLNRFIFKPILAHIERRESSIRRMEEESAKLREKGERSLAKYEQSLADIRHDATEIISAARKEAQAGQSKILQDARAEFKERIDASRAQISGEISTASETLKKEVDSFAGILAGKILGRKVER